MIKAVAYFRTSSKSGVGEDKDSESRQRVAVTRYSESNGIEIGSEFYDAAVSGADHLVDRDGFSKLMDYVAENDIKVILVETVNRLARDVFVQLTGYQLLEKHGVRLVPVDDPKHFDNISDNPMAEAIMIIMATLSMLDKKMLCKRMKSGIDKKRRETGRCEGRKPAPAEAIEMAKRLRDDGHTLREIGDSLKDAGYCVMVKMMDGDKVVRVMSDKPYKPQSIKVMLGFKKERKNV